MPGDLIDRYLRFEASELVAITTEVFAPEARRRLEEFSLGSSTRRTEVPVPVTLIEGVENVEPSFGQMIAAANWKAIWRVVRSMELGIPINIAYLIARRFGLSHEIDAGIEEVHARQGLLWR